MTLFKTTTTQLLLRTVTRPFALVALLLILSLLSSCSSALKRREATVRVLDQQSELLRKVRREREGAPLVTKVQADPVLHKAENHLIHAIQALLDSNRAVKAAL